MRRRPDHKRRRGSTLVEYAIVLSTYFLLTFGAIIVGWGMFVSNEVATLAREGARWAAVHGGTWKQENNKSALTTAADVYTSAIVPHLAGLDTSKLSYTVTWLDSGQMPTYVNGGGTTVDNRVTVTVNYNWVPQLFLSPVTFTGKSTMKVSY
jgi:Flp pilus assembly protein TadG